MLWSIELIILPVNLQYSWPTGCCSEMRSKDQVACASSSPWLPHERLWREFWFVCLLNIAFNKKKPG